MIRNYVMIAFRNLKKQFSYSLINIVGLALGIACTLVILLFVYGEWSYDRNFKDHERIYRVSTSWFGIGNFANGQEQLNELLTDHAETELTTRIQRLREVKVSSTKAKQVSEQNAYAVDSSFFDVFSYSLVSGNRHTCLNSTTSIVITEKVALKYFGTIDAIGQTLEVGDDKEPHQVTAVIQDPDFNTHLKGDIWMRYKPTHNTGWAQAATYNYVKLREGYGVDDLKNSLAGIIKTEAYPQFGAGMSYEDWIQTENSVKLFPVLLSDIYLRSKLKFELSPGGSESNLYVFGAVALLIIVLAMVNFINLSTARSARRAKEVGLRKAMGTTRKSLIVQFLSESIITSLFAMILALILAELFLSIYRSITGQLLLESIFLQWQYSLLALGLSLSVGALAGLYPAIYLTRFQPARVLKGNFQTVESKAGFRNVLVVFQFTMSITLILCAIVVLQQLQYLGTKDLGFDQENVINIENINDLGSEAFRQKLNEQSQVANSSFIFPAPGSQGIVIYTYRTKDMQEDVTLNTMMVDDKAINTLGFRLLEGRTFDPLRDTDSTAAILNETAVRDFGLEGEAIGAEINKGLKVIGVVSDFHFHSTGEKIAPVVMIFKPKGYSISYKLSGNINEFIEQARMEWAKFSPEEPLQYSFIDQNFEKLLEKEKIFAKTITFFTALAIFISCLGLYGLSVFTAEQRTKEIGIRKVCGASAQSIVILLNKNFTKLILISIVLSIPTSIYIIGQWLSNFAYQIELNPLVYIGGSLSALMLAWITVGFNSYAASMSDPVKTLKSE